MVSKKDSGRGGRDGSTAPIAGINQRVQATPAPKARRIKGLASNTTPIDRLVSRVVRSSQLSIAILDLRERFFDLLDIALRQLSSLGEIRDQRRHPTIEKAIQEPFGLLDQSRFARDQGSVKEPTAVLAPRDGPFFYETRQQRLDRAFVPVGAPPNALDDLSGRERVLAPKHVEHVLFGPG
jgi:hypothetical protein